jgi:hypothetical protein
MKKAILTAISFLSIIVAFAGNATFKGVIKDENGEGVDAAIIKFFNGDKVVKYVMSDEDGEFSITLDIDAPFLKLSIERLGYESIYREIKNCDQSLSFSIKEKQTELKEVVVSAPMITQRGDTLSYRLSSFAGLGDVSLKDAMKKIPGIEVADAGTIKYLGKDISNFYIEGMDLLGGRYNIATNNIPASYVSTIQVLNNHQQVKADKDIFSDDVAINVKLNSKAKLRPMGTYEAWGGTGDNDFLYQLSGAGMLFKPKFQTILTAKIGNIKEFADAENRDLIDNNNETLAHEAIGLLGASTPPISRERFISPNDRSITLNFLNKLSDDISLKSNIGYSYSKNDYDLESSRSFFDGSEYVLIDQIQASSIVTHKPSFGINYKLNSNNRYISDVLTGTASILRSELPTYSENSYYRQLQRLQDYNLKNQFSTHWSRHNLRWNFESILRFTTTPQGRISITNETNQNTSETNQTARSYSFFTRETLSGIYQRGNTRFYLPISLQLSSDKLRTALSHDENLYNNTINGEDFVATISPQYEYTHPQRKYIFRGSVNVKGEYTNFRNSQPIDSPTGINSFHFSCNPNIYFNYSLNAKSSLRIQAYYTHTLGDIMDLLTEPIQTDNLSRTSRIGILSSQKSLVGNIHYDFKLPIEMWFFNLDVNSGRVWNNLLNGQAVTSDLIQYSNVLTPNHSDSFSSSMNISKHFQAINTKIAVGASYRWSRNSVFLTNTATDYYNQSFVISPQLSTRPWEFVELSYNGRISKVFSRYLSYHSNYIAQAHKADVSFFPIKPLQLTASTEVNYQTISENNSKTITLFDAGVHYRFKHFRVGLNVNNILNQKHYSYKIFSGLNTFSYDYNLRGRELLVSFSFTN